MKDSAGRDLRCPPRILERVIRLRKLHGFTQKQVADRLGISQQAYSQYERGLRAIHMDIFVSLALLYGTTVDYILGLTNLVSRSVNP